MKNTIVTSCGDCPFWAREKEMYCSHPDAPSGYENGICWSNTQPPSEIKPAHVLNIDGKIMNSGFTQTFEGAPKWCPLRRESYNEQIMVNGKLKSERKITFK